MKPPRPAPRASITPDTAVTVLGFVGSAHRTALPPSPAEEDTSATPSWEMLSPESRMRPPDLVMPEASSVPVLLMTPETKEL